MLNRRHLRIKVLQAIYAHIQSEGSNLKAEEENLLTSIEKIYDLYLFQLSFVSELHFEAIKERDELKNKYFPTEEDLKPETNFTRNRILTAMAAEGPFQKALAQKKISWSKNNELVKKVFRKLRNSEEYKEYMKIPSPTFEQDRDFMTDLYKKQIFDDDLIESWYEELNIHWSDDIFVVNAGVLRTIKTATEDAPVMLEDLYKDREEDRDFVIQLFRKTLLHAEEYEKWIKEKAQNWELERIAMMDILLMKMALCEVLEFAAIPVKVTLNEYIEISKTFSTPKSNAFINGILDKLVAELKASGKISKSGRGLIDN